MKPLKHHYKQTVKIIFIFLITIYCIIVLIYTFPNDTEND